MTVVALVRRPSPRLADGIVTHVRRQPVDVERALEQWHGYVGALSTIGWEVVEAPPADDCPDSVFIEDTAIVFDAAAVVARPGADARQPETVGMAALLESFGYPVTGIEAPGTLDGGDVLKVGSTVYVGLGGRTNEHGAAQLEAALAAHGATLVRVPVSRVLHLKSAVTALPDGTIVGWEPAVDDRRPFPRFQTTPEESGAHVVVLDDRRVLMAADAPRTAALYRAMGYDPITVDISELQKLEGCVTCLSIRLRQPPHRRPAEH